MRKDIFLPSQWDYGCMSARNKRILGTRYSKSFGSVVEAGMKSELQRISLAISGAFPSGIPANAPLQLHNI
jgi:hypothetical protein